MTRSKLIERVDQLKINVYGTDVKVKFIDDLDGLVALQLLHQPYTPSRALDRELLAPEPFTDMYVYYLFAMIDQLNMEYDSYNNNMVLFNTEWEKYKNNLSHFELKGKVQIETLRDLIDYTDTLRMNTFSDEVKLQMINEVEGIIYNKLIRKADGPEFEPSREYTRALLIPEPYRDIYTYYLNASMAHLENNTEIYQQQTMLFDMAYEEYAKCLKRFADYSKSKITNVGF